MKKAILASTALLTTTGIAAADIAVTGTAEFGLSAYEVNVPATFPFPFTASTNGLQFHQDIDVTFTMSGESDNGIIFGASVDLDEDASAVGTDDGGVAIFISSDFGTLTMGDTDGALDWAMTEVGSLLNPGSLADETTSHFGYRSSYLDGVIPYDGQILRYDHTIGDFSFAASVELNDNTSVFLASDPNYALGLRYMRTYGDLTIEAGLGYQVFNLGLSSEVSYASGNSISTGLGAGPYTEIGGSLAATWRPADSFFDAIAIGIQASEVSSDTLIAGFRDGSIEHMGIGFGVTRGAFSLHANYGQHSDTFRGGFFERTRSGYGVSAGYDLGGGASILLGYADSEEENVFDTSVATQQAYSLGLSFTF